MSAKGVLAEALGREGTCLGCWSNGQAANGWREREGSVVQPGQTGTGPHLIGQVGPDLE